MTCFIPLPRCGAPVAGRGQPLCGWTLLPGKGGPLRCLHWACVQVCLRKARSTRAQRLRRNRLWGEEHLGGSSSALTAPSPVLYMRFCTFDLSS